jgi:Protein of unknown function (DUF3106)
MRGKLQFAGWLAALGMSAAQVVSSFAQGPRANWAQNRQDNKPPKQQSQPPRQQSQPPRQQPPRQQRQEQRQEPRQQEARRPQNQRQNSGANRPPNSNPNRADMAGRPNVNPNRPPSAYAPPKRFDSLPRQEQQKILQNNKNFEKLTPAQKQQREEAARNWAKLTPEQQNHVRNDVIPKWKQMPKPRQDAIQHRLAVLRNMPESARNQHLNDPNFTRGMSEEDKVMLRDLSHMHVGAPDPPNE